MKKRTFLGFEITRSVKDKKQNTEAFFQNQTPTSRLRGSYAVSFDGEKNVGEIGPVYQYILDHDLLRLRSWQSYLESEISKTVLNRFSIWVIDKGLRLKCSPVKDVLRYSGIDLNVESFNRSVESRFLIFSKSKRSSHNNMLSLNKLAKKAFINAKVGGDVLVVLRVVDGEVKVQLIDGQHLQSPSGSFDPIGKIYNGIEVDENGMHVAYHVRNGLSGTKRIEAWSSSTGLRMAYLVYGSEYRLDNMRGLPVISTSLETLKKIDRYKEASVGSAEERQKIAYAVEHHKESDGENPFMSSMASALDTDNSSIGSLPIDQAGEALANKIAATTNKQAFNLPPGSQLKALDSKGELFFKEFYETNAYIICAAVNIPPNVAFSLYTDSFSASRAATKDWEHTIEFERDDFQEQFYSPILSLWMHVQILKGNVSAPGYIEAFKRKDFDIIEAYLNCRFTGTMFPHIDPVKEVMAERLKLGTLAAHLPLTDAEAAAESLMSGEYSSTVEQFAEEIKQAAELGLKAIDPTKKKKNGIETPEA